MSLPTTHPTRRRLRAAAGWGLPLAIVAGVLASLGRPASEADLPGAAPDRAAIIAEAQAAAMAPDDAAGFPDKRGEGFTSYVRPSDELAYQVAAARLGDGASPADLKQAAEGLTAAWMAGAYHGPDPRQARRVAARQDAVLGSLARTGSLPERFDPAPGGSTPDGAAAGADGGASPAALDGLDVEGRLRLLVVPVEFAGEDTVESISHPVSMEDRTCITRTNVTFKGPLHNEIPQPGPRDNNTFWLERFDRDFYQKLILSEEGVTDRARPDLVDPLDGQPGIDLRGLTMANFFEELSAGKVDFDAGPAGILDWVQVPHSVAYYATTRCANGVAPRIQAQNGLPANRNAVRQMVADAVASINASQPDFPWADYDMDGDHVVDHVVFIHAGMDKSEGGGRDTYQQIWAHRGGGNVVADDRGTPDTADDIRVAGYTVQPENLNLGVLVHEFGHDLGLPDLYDTSGNGSDTVVWWGLMSTGSHPGRLKGSDPTHMEPWSKLMLGWRTPTVVTPTTDAAVFTLGQASGPPAGSLASLMIPIPPVIVRYVPLQGSSTQIWHSGADQQRADVKLRREVDLTAEAPGAGVALSFDLTWDTERDFDYVFLEASADGGQTYSQIKGFQVGTGTELTTPDGYADPEGSLATYGNLKHGYTGRSNGWRRVTHDLSPYAGKAITVRLRYVTDNGTLGYGAYADNFLLASDGATVWQDAVEGGDKAGWTSEPGSMGAGTTGEGWRLSDGTAPFPRYYLLEWRNASGHDRGLQWTYNTQYATLTSDGRREFRVDKVPSNVPGLLVWVWDTRWGGTSLGFGAPNNPMARTVLGALPSEGGKGGLSLMDAHPEPVRGPLNAHYKNDFGRWPFPPEDVWSGRVQTTDAAFGLGQTAPLTLTVATGAIDPAKTVITGTGYTARSAVPGFHDALGFSPGLEKLPQPITLSSAEGRLRVKEYAFSDADGGVTVPSAGYYPPRIPEGFTGKGAETMPPSVDIGADETIVVDKAGGAYALDIGAVAGLDIQGPQTGNPGDYGQSLGFHFVVEEQAEDGSWGKVRIWRDRHAAEQDGALAAGPAGGAAAELRSQVRNTGEAGDVLVHSAIDPATGLVESTLAPGMVPVKAPAEAILSKLRADGAAALETFRVPAHEADAVAWAGQIKAGAFRAIQYGLTTPQPYAEVGVVQTVYALESEALSAVDQRRFTGRIGDRIYLPTVRRSQ